MRLRAYLRCFITALACALVQGGFAQSTSFIPPNLFLTDNGRLFWYRSSGERVVDVAMIREAEKSLESRPSDDYLQGNWGQATNGFQLSLRFGKSIFTNGEPIMATILMRNITDTPQTYYRPIKIIVEKDGKVLRRKNESGLLESHAPPMKTLFPQTQDKYIRNIQRIYTLSSDGKYLVQAVSGRPSVSSKSVSITITNGFQPK